MLSSYPDTVQAQFLEKLELLVLSWAFDNLLEGSIRSTALISPFFSMAQLESKTGMMQNLEFP